MKHYELISSKCVDIYTPHIMLSVLPGPYLFILTKTLGVAYDLPLFWDGTANYTEELGKIMWQSFPTSVCQTADFESDSPLQSLCVSSPSTWPTFFRRRWVHLLHEAAGVKVSPQQPRVLFKKVKHLSTDVCDATSRMCWPCHSDKEGGRQRKSKISWGNVAQYLSMPVAQDWSPPLKK